MNRKRGQIPLWARGTCAATVILLVLFLPGLAYGQGPGAWEEYSGNPIIDPPEIDAYYPSVLYDASPTPFSGHGEANPFKMWHDNDLQYRVSSDGISWTKVGDMSDGTITGLPAGQVRHPLVEYYADGFSGRNSGDNPSGATMYYRLWFWHLGQDLYSVAAIHYAESPNGKAWYNVQPLQNGTVPIVTGIWPDWNRGSYGPCDVLYNPGASNSGTDWTFWMYYDGTTGGDEAIGLGFSADGITWTGYDAGGDGQADAVMNGTYVAGDWDYNYVSRATIWREGPGDYRMWYSAGIDTMNHGLGYATSADGLNWTRDPQNPIFHKDDTGYPSYPWRQNRSYTPMVLRAGNLWFMWYSGENGGGKTIGVAYSSAGLPEQVMEIEKAVYPTEIPVGEDSLFTITVTNASLDAVDDVVVTDEMDAGLEILDVQTTKGAISTTGQLVTVDVGQMAADETVVITIRVLAIEPGQVPNVARVTAPRAEATAEATLNVVAAAAEEEFVPEPASLLLLGGGLLTLAGYANARRRGRSS
jgi:uncharacterized repeat protein (TIGR01451 family)